MTGITSVSTDDTLEGDGNMTALSVANPFTGDDEIKLDGIATGAEVNVRSDWTETDSTDDSFIRNKPTLAPSNAEQNVQSDWTATTGDALIRNKPTIPAAPAAGELVPDGGTTGQVLAKTSGADGDTDWTDAPTGGGAETFVALTDTPVALGADGTVLGVESGVLAFVEQTGGTGGGGEATTQLGSVIVDITTSFRWFATGITLSDSDWFLVNLGAYISGVAPQGEYHRVNGTQWRGLVEQTPVDLSQTTPTSLLLFGCLKQLVPTQISRLVCPDQRRRDTGGD